MIVGSSLPVCVAVIGVFLHDDLAEAALQEFSLAVHHDLARKNLVDFRGFSRSRVNFVGPFLNVDLGATVPKNGPPAVLQIDFRADVVAPKPVWGGSRQSCEPVASDLER